MMALSTQKALAVKLGAWRHCRVAHRSAEGFEGLDTNR
jgi:hypothetical protein